MKSLHPELRSSRAAMVLRGGVSALALAGVAFASPALAQDAPAGADATNPGSDESLPTNSPDTGATPAEAAAGEIVVTGIRQSLRSSQQLKQNSDVVVDSITAEDIGALPDRSVTEALQRVPGVSISRFAGADDPDHFSVEGSGVVVRGLTYVRSELNGRDSFTANNGRGLSFSDVPAELMGGVDVFKSPSADMIEGGIAGTVNLRTRVPFDSRGTVVGGSIEGSYGDFSEKWAPTVSVFGSTRFDTSMGEIGLLANFVYSRLRSRSDGIQISNFGRRTANADGTLIGAIDQYDRDVWFPRGAAMRSSEFDRERYGYAAAAQWRSNDRTILATFQFLRSDSRLNHFERAVEIATDIVGPNGDSRPVDGTSIEFDDNGIFDSGVITAPTGWRSEVQGAGFQQGAPVWACTPDGATPYGSDDPRPADRDGCAYSNLRTPQNGLQSNNQTRGAEQRNVTSDYGANVRWNASDRLTFNFDYHHTDSSVDNLDVTIMNSSFQNVAINLNGKNLPDVAFVAPEVCVGPARNTDCDAESMAGTNYSAPSLYGLIPDFGDPSNSFFRATMDHIQQSAGNEDAFRVDADFDFEDSSFLRSIRMGYRFADRKNVARVSAYNWGAISEIWGNGGPVWLDEQVNGNPGTPGGYTGASFSELYGFPNFLRGQGGNPLGDQARLFYRANPAAEYQDVVNFSNDIVNEWIQPGADGVIPPRTGSASGWLSLRDRPGVIAGTPFLPSEINPVNETNHAVYAMARFGRDFDNGWRLSGNIGLRYTMTDRDASGFQVFTNTSYGECLPPNPENPNPQPPSPFCSLSEQVRNQIIAFQNGAELPTRASINYAYLLPSFNARLEVGGGLQFRFAFYNGIAPPDFGLTRNFYNLTLTTAQEDLDNNNQVPFARAQVGNPYLRPTEASNFDLSAEWYFSDVGQLSFAAFYKRLTNVVTNGSEQLSFTNNGATFDAFVTTPINSEDAGEIKGLEISYQQTYNFLPGLLRGFGLSATYTFVDSQGVEQTVFTQDPTAANTPTVDTSLLPLQGLSKHTFNISPFYEVGPLSVRLAYSWRSRYLVTVRDVIIPNAPIFGEATGQLDGSIFFSINENVRIGVQGVNLLNEVTRTTQVLAADEDAGITTAPRSWFMNDRRFTAVLRANF